MTLAVISSTHHSVHSLDMVNRHILDFKLQTNPNWKLSIIHDGPNDQYFEDDLIDDVRVKYIQTDENKGNYGHYWRNFYLQKVPTTPYYWFDRHTETSVIQPPSCVMLMNSDSQVAPVLVEKVLEAFEDENTDVCMWRSGGHHHYDYNDIPRELWLQTNHCDFASFAVRTEIGQKAGQAITWEAFASDGEYAEAIFAIVKDPMRVRVLSCGLYFQN